MSTTWGGGAETALGVRKKVTKLLDLCRENGITLNPDKFCVSRTIELGGFEISSNHENPTPMIRPTKIAVNKLLDYKAPTDKKGVQRFLGLLNTFRHWSNKFNASLPNIRSLVTKNSVWTWNETHQQEFETVKKMASEMDFLSPYDPEKEIIIKTDGLKTGLGYILFQPGDDETKKESGESNDKGDEGKSKQRKNLAIE